MLLQGNGVSVGQVDQVTESDRGGLAGGKLLHSLEISMLVVVLNNLSAISYLITLATSEVETFSNAAATSEAETKLPVRRAYCNK